MELPLHPKLVHLPIALAILMPLFSGVLALAILRGWLPLRAWLLAVGAQLLLVGSSVLAMRSGEDDEERVEGRVPEAALEAHEEAAERFTWSAAAALLLTLSPLLLHRHRRAVAVGMLATTAAATGVLWLGYEVGRAGGEMVYQHGAAAAHATNVPKPGAVPNPRRRVDDDDR